jgi:hypothetical protein
MPEPPDAMDQAELLKLIVESYEHMERLIDSMDEAQLIQPGVYDNLSTKDILAHLSAWERMAADWIGAALCGEKPVLYAPGFEVSDPDDEAVMHRLNDHIYQENHDRPLAEVLTQFRATHLHTLVLVQALSEVDLNDPHRFEWCNSRPLWTLIAVNTYEHYEEHILLIQTWLDGRP